jgi:hypothetical protein
VQLFLAGIDIGNIDSQTVRQSAVRILQVGVGSGGDWIERIVGRDVQRLYVMIYR